MSEAGRELGELKREVVEARNQAIKTDNQVKNLSLDIKGFEKRFDNLDGRVRLTSFGVNVLIAAVIAVAATVVSSVCIRGYEAELVAVRAASAEQARQAQEKLDVVGNNAAQAERRQQTYSQASGLAERVLDLLDERQDQQAGEALGQLDLSQLTPLERRLAEKRFGELRHREADTAYRNGRNAALTHRHEAAVGQLRRALSLEPHARTAPSARYLLATSLYTIKRYDEAEPLLRSLARTDLKNEDRSALEEAQYYLAASLARLGKRDESKTLFARLHTSNGRFTQSARAYLNALESGAELPVDLSGGRVRSVRASTSVGLGNATSRDYPQKAAGSAAAGAP